MILRPTVVLQPQERPELVIKSYTYNDQPTPLVPPQEESKNLKIEKEEKGEISIPEKETPPQPISSEPMPISHDLRHPIRLIGDQKIEKSLFKVIGEALSYTLVYPKLAIDFQVRGRAEIGFSLHPDGRVTGVQLLSSSGSGILDDAALVAVKDMSPVKRTNEFLKGTKFLVIGIIFGG